MTARRLIRFGSLGYLALILVAPVGLIFWRAFEHGWHPFWVAISNPDAVHALKLTLEVTLVAVPLNTVFGVLCGLAIVRHRMPGMGLVNALVDLPMALSPVVVGLSLYLLYGRQGWFGPWLTDHGVRVLFAYPGILLATTFVSLPFVVREVVPVLREIGTEQEEAAATLGARAFTTFRRITLPAIRWAVAYGVVLTTARSLGEFGAVAIVSGGIAGRTQTLTQYVQASYDNYSQTSAYAAAVLLAGLAILTLLLMTKLRPREEVHGNRGA
ncbi:MAG: sulfate transporter, inner rane subunit [Actinomycetia bacterium]|jgi:sulfate transport system permease protein|nr:sulfate transporter, inner rane subunit [Actinomycetes bacterium]